MASYQVIHNNSIRDFLSLPEAQAHMTTAQRGTIVMVTWHAQPNIDGRYASKQVLDETP